MERPAITKEEAKFNPVFEIDGKLAFQTKAAAVLFIVRHGGLWTEPKELPNGLWRTEKIKVVDGVLK